MEALVGARWASEGGVDLGGAIGVGLTAGVGVPDVRGVVSVGCTSPGLTPAPSVEVPDDTEDTDDTGGSDGSDATDTDGDGIADPADECADLPETLNEYADDDGCPDRVAITGSRLRLPVEVTFAEGRNVLEGESEEVLHAVAHLLRDREDLTLLQIEGHADDREGDDDTALLLSEERADAVYRWLVDHGIDSGRLTAVGVGSARPADESDPAANRRVEFRILGR